MRKYPVLPWSAPLVWPSVVSVVQTHETRYLLCSRNQTKRKIRRDMHRNSTRYLFVRRKCISNIKLKETRFVSKQPRSLSHKRHVPKTWLPSHHQPDLRDRPAVLDCCPDSPSA